MSEHLDHYLSAWDLSDPQPLAATRSSDVYTVMFQGTRAVLKILTPAGHEERPGAATLRYFNGHGAVQLFRADDQAQLLEYVEGEDLVGMVKSGHDEQATAIIAEVLNQLHASQGPAPDVEPLRVWFNELFKKADADLRNGLKSIYTRAAPIAESVLVQPQNVHVLHGDMHHENVRHAPRGWVAFDPKGLIGERAYDAANTLCNPINMTELVQNEDRLLRNADILAQNMRIDLGRVLTFTFIYTCLSASWSLTDDPESQDAEDTVKIAEIVEPHLPQTFY